MRIALEKFGKTLTSRQLGSEALKAFQPARREIRHDESLDIDFSGVLTMAPSWADEFLTPLLNQFGERLVLLPSDNLSVQTTIKLLEEINERRFTKKL